MVLCQAPLYCGMIQNKLMEACGQCHTGYYDEEIPTCGRSTGLFFVVWIAGSISSVRRMAEEEEQSCTRAPGCGT